VCRGYSLKALKHPMHIDLISYRDGKWQIEKETKKNRKLSI
jgi:hypothetical protein